jgi:hypothetical protein
LTSKSRRVSSSLAIFLIVAALMAVQPMIADQMITFLPGGPWKVFCRALTTCLTLFVGMEVLPEIFTLDRRKPNGSHERIPK